MEIDIYIYIYGLIRRDHQNDTYRRGDPRLINELTFGGIIGAGVTTGANEANASAVIGRIKGK